MNETLSETELAVLRSLERSAAGDIDGRADALAGIDPRLVFIACCTLRDLGLVTLTGPFEGAPTMLGRQALGGSLGG